MLIFLYILFIVLCLLFSRSKSVFFGGLIFLWLILAGTSGNADEPVYLSRYVSPQLWQGQTEVLYGMFMSFCRQLGLDFLGFKMINATLQLVLLAVPIYRRAKYPNIILALYSIFPFAMDVTQLRNALATSVMIFSLDYLLRDIDRVDVRAHILSLNDIKFIVGIIVATGIHTASFFWLLLLVAKKLSIRATIIFTIAFGLVSGTIFSPMRLDKLMSIFGAGARMSAYVSAAYTSTKVQMLSSALYRVIIFAAISIIILIILNRYKSVDNNTDIFFAIKCNIIVLCVIPLMIQYTPEMYRMQIGLAIFNYIVILNSYNIHRSDYLQKDGLSVKNCAITIGLILLTVSSLYLLAIWGGNFKVVIVPIFTNNSLVQIFF
ncbi:EpsG family protein [Lactiplantibacillus plantarum]|uniref:EpsG family protein n=1 Tax=Lactiplantibacillus plantarum TaxID=1590 RepID=UPI003CFA683D